MTQPSGRAPVCANCPHCGYDRMHLNQYCARCGLWPDRTYDPPTESAPPRTEASETPPHDQCAARDRRNLGACVLYVGHSGDHLRISAFGQEVHFATAEAPDTGGTAETELRKARECIESGCTWYSAANGLSADLTRIAIERDELRARLAESETTRDEAVKFFEHEVETSDIHLKRAIAAEQERDELRERLEEISDRMDSTRRS